MTTDDNSRQWGMLFLGAAVLFGGIVRFAPALLAHGPVNDGGMFFTMIEDLRANALRLPAFTTYNHSAIPFAYPPLSLYAGALLASLGVPAMKVIQWLPPLVSTASILAFYWLSGLLLGSKSKAALAALAYALMPRSFSWYVMGGGLSRSFGVLFLLLTAGCTWLLFSRPSWKVLLLTALFGAGAVLSHPETALHTALACALIWLFRGRSVRGVRDAAMAAAGVLLLTSPWWGTVLAQHGVAPLASALNTGGHSGLFWTPWVTMDFAEERFVTLLTVLGLIGFAVQCLRRDWLLPAWMLAPFLVEPRSATAIGALPLAMMAAVGLADVVLPGLHALATRKELPGAEWPELMSSSKAVRITAAYIVISALIGAFAYDLSLAHYTVPQPSLQAMVWVNSHAPADARFLVLTGRADPFSDATSEWFPALTKRTSVNTIQGREWTLGPAFMPFLASLRGLQACMNQPPACLDAWSSSQHTAFSYVFLEKPAGQAAEPPALLLFELRQHADYTLVFENDGVAVFARR